MLANDALTPVRHEAHPTVPIKPAEVHLLDRVHALYRYRNVAIVAFIVILAGASLKAYWQTPLYRATVRLLIEIEDERTLALESLGTNRGYDYQDPEPYFQTQYRILTGRDLARRVVVTLDLAHAAEFGGSPGAAAPEAVVDAVASRVSVDPVRASRLVDVSFVSPNPNLAAQAVNTLAEEYVTQNLELRRQNMARSLEWLAQELVRQKSLVETSERAMAQYREDQNALSLEDRQNIVIARLNLLNESATRARANRAQKESLYKRLASLGSDSSPDTIPALLQNAYIQTMKSQVADLERRKALLSERYGDKHPEILTINASIDDANRQLRLELAKALDAIRHDYESALLEERTLASALEEQKDIATDLDRKSVAYTVLEREAESNRDIYQALLRREKELQVLANSQGNNVRLVERAGVPGAPFSPNIRRSAMLGGMVGLLVALGLAVGLDHFNDTIRTPDDVTRRLGLPFLGLIPAVKGQPGRPVLSVSSDFGEAIRALRTSLALSHTTPGSAIVLVTSAQPLEGKTTTACNLAAALAYGGARVLLIDADMRRPGVHSGFGVKNGRGLADLLNGHVPLTDAVQRLAEPSLWVMPAGSVPSNPSELLASERMDALMRQVQTGPFDWVIIDTPPVLAVTDASIAARWASGVAFVLGSEMTRGRLAERAVHTLAAARPRFIGAVLNRVDVSRSQYYYTHHYGYGTGYLTAEG
jgi:capsular exopolysaccharide synthesis family protein